MIEDSLRLAELGRRRYGGILATRPIMGGRRWFEKGCCDFSAKSAKGGSHARARPIFVKHEVNRERAKPDGFRPYVSIVFSGRIYRK